MHRSIRMPSFVFCSGLWNVQFTHHSSPFDLKFAGSADRQMVKRGSAGRKVGIFNFLILSQKGSVHAGVTDHSERSQHTNAFRPRSVPSIQWAGWRPSNGLEIYIFFNFYWVKLTGRKVDLRVPTAARVPVRYSG